MENAHLISGKKEMHILYLRCACKSSDQQNYLRCSIDIVANFLCRSRVLLHFVYFNYKYLKLGDKPKFVFSPDVILCG